MTDFCVNCGKRDCEMICPECNERTLTIYEQKLIAEFLEDLEGRDDTIPLIPLIEKWELRKNDTQTERTRKSFMPLLFFCLNTDTKRMVKTTSSYRLYLPQMSKRIQNKD